MLDPAYVQELCDEAIGLLDRSVAPGDASRLVRVLRIVQELRAAAVGAVA
jgi:hypothetical protein